VGSDFKTESFLGEGGQEWFKTVIQDMMPHHWVSGSWCLDGA